MVSPAANGNAPAQNLKPFGRARQGQMESGVWGLGARFQDEPLQVPDDISSPSTGDAALSHGSLLSLIFYPS